MHSGVTLDDLVFVGLRGYVVALHRDTGGVVWSNNNLKSGYTTLLLDGDRLIVSTNGYLFCLDPFTGGMLWEQPLTGYGVGIASLASLRGTVNPFEAMAAAAAAQAATSSTSTTSIAT